jgi:Lrp/AsnC family leucine-responsive transcriptional regulator
MENLPKISRAQLDKDEKTILAELKQNANRSIETIAKKCGFSRQKVWRIIKRLEESRMIWGYTAVVDEKKNQLNHYTLLIKRTITRLDEKTVNIIVSRKLEEMIADLGVTVESSYYVNGEYDWVLTFTATDIIHAKKFCESILALHLGAINKTSLLETLFVVKDHYILNPESKKLKELL